MPLLSRDANKHLRRLLMIAIGIVASMQFYFVHGLINQVQVTSNAVNLFEPKVESENGKDRTFFTSKRFKGTDKPTIKSQTVSSDAIASVSTKLITTSNTSTSHNNFCQGITPITSSKSQTTKYLIWYPRAGMGNILVSYVSAVLYACLTQRILKIAPPSSREMDVFTCNEYWEDNPSGICRDLEMDQDLISKYNQLGVEIKRPEAWDASHCTSQTKTHLQYFLCDDGISNDEFIAISSCQYWGDLLYSNPYFRTRLASNEFREVVRSKLSSPSDVIREKMVQDMYEVCIHVRWNLEVTKFDLGKDWANNLGTCVRNILSRKQNDDDGVKKEVMLFTMHEDVRDVIERTFEHGDHPYHVHFASEVNSTGGSLGLSSDNHAGVADMFSMGHRCVNLLGSREASTYFMIGANLMDDMRVFPGSSWAGGCMEGSEFTELNPIGDFWNKEEGLGGGNGDVCNLRDFKCPVEKSFGDKMISNETLIPKSDAAQMISKIKHDIQNEIAANSRDAPLHFAMTNSTKNLEFCGSCAYNILITCSERVNEIMNKYNNLMRLEVENALLNYCGIDYSTEPYVLLHVGPHKTGITSIKEFLYNSLKWNAPYLKKDKFAIPTRAHLPGYFKDTGAMLNFAHCMIKGYGKDGGQVTAGKCLEIRGIFPNFLKQAYNQSKNVLIVAEDLDRLEIDYVRVLFWLFPYRRIRIVVSYRRMHHWLPSFYSQVVKMYTKKYIQGLYHYPSFLEFVDEKYHHLKTVHSVEVANRYRQSNKFESVDLLNLHSEIDLLENLFCNYVPFANSTCEAIRKKGGEPKKSNQGHDHDFERLATEALHMGKIKDYHTAIAKKVTNKLKSLMPDERAYPKQCLNETFQNDLLQTEKELEEKYFADWYESQGGEQGLREDYEKTAKSKMCSMNVELILSSGMFDRYFAQMN